MKVYLLMLDIPDEETTAIWSSVLRIFATRERADAEAERLTQKYAAELPGSVYYSEEMEIEQ